jgi:myosin-crossreactive antigen
MMNKNENAILKLKSHLYMIYGLSSDLNGEYGIAKPLMSLYGKAFNHITTELLPQMGMSEEEVEDLVSRIQVQARA